MLRLLPANESVKSRCSVLLPGCQDKDLAYIVAFCAHLAVVVVKCIYEPYAFSHSAATSSAECNRCSPLQLGLWAAVDNM